MADAAALAGLDSVLLGAALRSIAAEGSASGGIIDRALDRVSADLALVPSLVETFRAHAPVELPLLPQARALLEDLRPQVSLGLITDGDPTIQQAKIHALGIADAFDIIVLSDELGGDRRKPHPAPFECALRALGTPAPCAVYVGDNPDKDVVGAIGVRMGAIRVRSGEYSRRRNPVEPLFDFADVAAAAPALLAMLANRPPATARISRSPPSAVPRRIGR